MLSPKIARFMMIAALFALATSSASAGLIILPAFDTSITNNVNAAAIEGAVETAISTIEGLYSNSLVVPVTFEYTPGAVGNLESTTQFYYNVSYSTYVGLLEADSLANPENTVLASALANLPSGNDADGSARMAIAGNQLAMLGITGDPANAVINLNSNQIFAFSRPVPSGQFDAVGGLEHELDEVLGGGGSGSTLNNCLRGNSFFCGKYGSLDLYRYSAPGVPSFTTSPSATSYFSIDGGATSVASFNQNSAGDFADFAPTGTGNGELIQDAFNRTGQDEAYTISSPEFTMLESIGWDPVSSSPAIPEPGTMVLFGAGLGVLAMRRRRLG